MSKNYYVYILGNNRGTIYTGVTNDIERRIQEHKTSQIKGFAQKYTVDRLLYFEKFDTIQEAKEAERMIKGWRRSKKLDLIRQQNAKFVDLAEDWFTER